MIGKIDNQVLEKFKVFQEHEKGEVYRDLDLGSVEFEKVALSDEEYFEFIKGRNHYIKKYNIANKGKYPLATGSVKNDSIAYYVKPINITDIITQKCISFNKDGDSKIFYRDYEFLMDRHHIAIIPSELLMAKYLYFALISYFKKMKFGWGENVADVPTVSIHSIPIPKDYNENYKSIDIQKAIVNFLEFWKVDFTEVYREKISKMKPMLQTMKQNLISSTFALDSKIVESFNDFAKDEGFDVELEEIEFEDKELKDIAQKINAGATPPRKNSALWTNLDDVNGIPWLDIDRKEFEQYKIRTYREKITQKGLKASSTWIVPKNSIMITIGGSLGFIATNEFDTCTNQNILNVILDENYSSNFVIHVLDNFYKYNVRNNPSGYGNLSKTSEEQRKVLIPIKTRQYNSLDLQNLLVSYWEMILGNFKQREKLFDRALELCDKIDEAFLYRTFSKIKWSK